MSVKSGSEIPITKADLNQHLTLANTLLKSVTYQPKRDVAALRAERAQGQEKPSGLVFSREFVPGEAKPLSILALVRQINKGDELLEENLNATLNTVRTGIQIGLHVANLFGKYSGLEALRGRQSRNELTGPAEQADWKNKMEAQAAITLFVSSFYITWKLSSQSADELPTVHVDFAGLPEPLALRGQVQALNGALYHWGSYLSAAQTGLEVLKYTQLFFKATLDDLKTQAQAFEPNAGVFIDKSYRLEGTTFSVNGFHADVHGAGASVEFRRVDINDIVGNKDAKHHAYRIAQYLIAYDAKRKMNPLVELGAFPWIYLLKGKPGTGKTMIIGATLTLVDDYCRALGIPFRAHPFPNTIVSTFQGGSAENMQNWMNVLKNPNEIIIAPIDDAETAFESRTRQGISSGVREVINTFLVNTEGATAVIRGNAIMLIATNIPDQLDLAVMSRIQGRASVDGAISTEDWMDQIRLWTGKIDGWNKDLVDLSWPQRYEFLAAQGLMLETKSQGSVRLDFTDKRLEQIHDRLEKAGLRTNNFEYFGTLYGEVAKVFPQFSSRDERNIRTAVMTRFFDFDFPSQWLERKELFVEKSYDEKRTMILDLARQNLGKLKFSDVMFEEAVRYLNATVSILDGGINRRIDERAEEIRINHEAHQRFEKKS